MLRMDRECCDLISWQMLTEQVANHAPNVLPQVCDFPSTMIPYVRPRVFELQKALHRSNLAVKALNLLVSWNQSLEYFQLDRGCGARGLRLTFFGLMLSWGFFWMTYTTACSLFATRCFCRLKPARGGWNVHGFEWRNHPVRVLDAAPITLAGKGTLQQRL